MVSRSLSAVRCVMRSATVLAILGKPRLCLSRIRETSPWLGALLAVTLSAAAVGVISGPYTEKGVRLAMEERLSGTSAAVMVEETVAVGPWWLAVVGDMVVAPLRILIQTLFLWGLALSFGGHGTFRQTFSVTVHLNVVSQLHAWAVALWLALRGIEAIESVSDASPKLGLDMVLRSGSLWLEAVFAGLNPFSLWFVVLLTAAAGTVFGVRRSSGVAVGATYWLITVALTAAGRTLAVRLLEI